MNDADKFAVVSLCFVISSGCFFMAGLKYEQSHPHMNIATVTRYVDKPIPVPDPQLHFSVSKDGFGQVELSDSKGKVYQTAGGYVKDHPCQMGYGHIAYCKLQGAEGWEIAIQNNPRP